MPKDFSHQSLNLNKDMPLVYTAMSKHLFYYRMYISKFVLEQGAVPLNPFMVFDYFLFDAVKRDTIREANNSIVKRSDEIWVFGAVSDGVLAEIQLSKKMGKPVKYFKIEKGGDIVECQKDEVLLEDDVRGFESHL